MPFPVYKEKTLKEEQEGKRGAKTRNYILDFKCNFLLDLLLQNQARQVADCGAKQTSKSNL